MGVASASFFAAGGLPNLSMAQNRALSDAPFYSLSNMGPLQAPDHNGLMLPAGFQSRIVARSSQAAVASSSYRWHASPDGGACFATEEGGWIYVSNSEENSSQGGVGALKFNASGELIDSYSICRNTSRNCAGGPTPWGTWLTCEEFEEGRVFECDPSGQRDAVVRPALGTFEHEAAAVDADNNCIYLTEDVRDGGFYRFVSETGLPDLENGRLEIASVRQLEGKSYIIWLVVPDPHAIEEATRHQLDESMPFNGGEGIAIHNGVVYFTTKGDNRVWAYHSKTQQLEIVYDIATSANPILSGVDNVVITPSGDVLVAEDGGDMQIVALTPEMQAKPFVQIIGQDSSEICGPAFDPSYQRMYFSSQNGETGRGEDGITYEISWLA